MNLISNLLENFEYEISFLLSDVHDVHYLLSDAHCLGLPNMPSDAARTVARKTRSGKKYFFLTPINKFFE